MKQVTVLSTKYSNHVAKISTTGAFDHATPQRFLTVQTGQLRLTTALTTHRRLNQLSPSSDTSDANLPQIPSQIADHNPITKPTSQSHNPRHQPGSNQPHSLTANTSTSNRWPNFNPPTPSTRPAPKVCSSKNPTHSRCPHCPTPIALQPRHSQLKDDVRHSISTAHSAQPYALPSPPSRPTDDASVIHAQV